MQFITSLFGGSGNTIVTAVFALGIVIVLIILGVWLLKMVFNASTNVARGRNRRLSVVDSMQLDPKRQLLIVRRDNVEHLILTGGPQDVVVETGIAVEDVPASQPSRRPVPMVAGRKPVRVSAAPAAETPVQATIAPGYGNPVPAKSLRHTGLMRAPEPVVTENSDRDRPDSAKEDARLQQSESNGLGDDEGSVQREGHTANRN